MKPLSRISPGGLLISCLALLLALPAPGATPPDPLAAELAYWQEQVQTQPSTHEIWLDVKASSQGILARIEKDLQQGRRLLATERLSRVRLSLEAALYLVAASAKSGSSVEVFESEWRRLGTEIERPVGAIQELHPAALRALAEAALPQAREYYQASLEYGRNTQPDNGLFYLGSARAQHNLPGFLGKLSAPTPSNRLAPRALDAELEALESDLLAVYRPPASIDRHGEFIVASAAVKEAREANAAGLYHGALLTYLKAVERLALLKGGSLPANEEISRGLAEAKSRLEQAGGDHSLGQLFVETALSELDNTPAGQPSQRAAAILGEVLPKYFAALGPAPPLPLRLNPQTQVTLVRWPYT